MFEDLENNAAFGDDKAFELLQELEGNRPEEIRRQRAQFRVAVKATVTLQSANASQMLDFRARGTTGDISRGGLGTMFPIPARVGDVYRLQFNRDELDLPLTFARCVRCRLVREDAYECGFSFFAPITLPANLAVSGKASLE